MALPWKLSNVTQQRLKVVGMTALVLGITWYIHKQYKQRKQCTQHINNQDSIDLIDDEEEFEISDNYNHSQSTLDDDDIISIDTIDITTDTLTDIHSTDLTYLTQKLQLIDIFTPIIKVHDAIHGLSKIELKNLTGNETSFQIELSHQHKTQIFHFNLNNIATDHRTDTKYISCRLRWIKGLLRWNPYSLQN